MDTSDAQKVNYADPSAFREKNISNYADHRRSNYADPYADPKVANTQGNPKFASSADIFKMMDISRRKPGPPKSGTYAYLPPAQ